MDLNFPKPSIFYDAVSREKTPGGYKYQFVYTEFQQHARPELAMGHGYFSQT